MIFIFRSLLWNGISKVWSWREKTLFKGLCSLELMAWIFVAAVVWVSEILRGWLYHGVVLTFFLVIDHVFLHSKNLRSILWAFIFRLWTWKMLTRHLVSSRAAFDAWSVGLLVCCRVLCLYISDNLGTWLFTHPVVWDWARMIRFSLFQNIIRKGNDLSI